MLRDMGHPTVTGARIRPATVTGARIPIAAGTTAGFAGRHTVTHATLITTQISGMAVPPGPDTNNGDRQRLTALPPW
jgi:hypothetical protein